MMPKLWKYLALIILTSIALTPSCRGSDRERKLIMILFDAFRWDYIDLLPNLKGFTRLVKQGVRAKYLLSEFPTVSWPNHYSITTGLHIASHGMVENRMYDPLTKKVFRWGRPDYNDTIWWDGGEPIWITATRQGKRARMYYWLGGEVRIRGLLPEYFIKYPGDPGASVVQIKAGIDETMTLMAKNKTDLAGFYFDRTDQFAHEDGLFSKESNASIYEADDIVTYLMDSIETAGLNDTVDVMVFSDHGMTYKDPKMVIHLADYFTEESWSDAVEWSMIRYSDSMVWPKPGKKDWFYNQVKDKHPHLRVLLKEDIPEDKYWHFRDAVHTPPIVMLADTHWTILGVTHHYRDGATHGYDNHDPDMRGIFMAKGPDFKENYTAEAFPNVDIYQMMCKILQLEPSPHNGTWEHVVDLMVPEHDKRRSTMDAFWIFAMFLLFFIMC